MAHKNRGYLFSLCFNAYFYCISFFNFTAAIGIIILYFLPKEHGVSNNNGNVKERSFFGESLHLVGQYFKARFLITLILGAACYLFMWLVLDLKWRVPVSIIVGLFNLVPYIGPIAAMILSAIVVVFQDPMDVLWMIIFQFAFQLIDSIMLSPLLMGKSMGLHPMVVFFAIFIGGSVWGIVGMIVATPIAAIAALAVRRIRKSIKEKRQFEEQQSVNQDSGDINGGGTGDTT